MNKMQNIQDEFYTLIGAIQDEDVSEMKVLWASLATALLETEIPGWHKPRSSDSSMLDVSDILNSLPDDLNAEELANVCHEAEELSILGSFSHIDDEDLEKLVELSYELESLSEEFIYNLERF